MDKFYKDLAKDIATVCDIYKYLNIQYNQRHLPISLIGDIEVVDENGYPWRVYHIKIAIPSRYPFGFPVLYELSRKIPWTEDRHIYKDGSCCVCALPEQIIRGHQGITIKRFVDEYAVPFLANQIYFEETGDWASGQYAHGIDGIKQYYYEFLKTDDDKIVQQTLNFALQPKAIGRNLTCFCGKGKYKKCHLKHVEYLSKLGYSVITQHIRYFK